jgi:hypothetical protein
VFDECAADEELGGIGFDQVISLTTETFESDLVPDESAWLVAYIQGRQHVKDWGKTALALEGQVKFAIGFLFLSENIVAWY